MKRNVFISIVVLGVALYPGNLMLSAQHGHGVGGGIGVDGGLGNGAGLGTEVNRAAGAKANAQGTSANVRAGTSLLTSTNPGDVLDRNTHLSANLESMLGLNGPDALATLKADASGFKNFGQFMAAVHVSHNLDIPFAQFQTQMTGKDAVSLGKAIQTLKPGADSKNEIKKANAQVKADVDASAKAKAQTSAS